MGAPGFWDDQAAGGDDLGRARAPHAAGSSATSACQSEFEDAARAAALDDEMEDEIAESIAPLRAELERLQEDALFNGEYDAGDAVVTIHCRHRRHRRAGLGRDAAAHVPALGRPTGGFQTELIEASPGEEAGLKSATFTVKGENAYGIAQGRARRPPARAAVAVRLGPPPPHLLRRGDREPAARRRLGPGRDRRGRAAHRHLPRLAAPAASTSTRPTPRCASRTSRRGSSSSARTSARRRSNKADRDADAALPPDRAGGGGARGETRARARRGAGHRLRQSDPQSTSCTRTRWSRIIAPTSRSGNAQGVLDGDLDGFIHAYLLAKRRGSRESIVGR